MRYAYNIKKIYILFKIEFKFNMDKFKTDN